MQMIITNTVGVSNLANNIAVLNVSRPRSLKLKTQKAFAKSNTFKHIYMFVMKYKQILRDHG